MSELQLLVGLVGAVGLALLVGTVAALVTYRRTGTFPGWPDGPDAPDPSTRVRPVIARAVAGGALTVVAIAIIVALETTG